MSTHAIPSAQDLVAVARAQIRNLTVDEVADELQDDEVVLIDLREQAERDVHGAIPGTIHIPRGMLEFCADPGLPVHADELDPSRRIILYCALGNRSALAAVMLTGMGFPHVAHLDGGFDAWRRAGRSIDAASGTESACWAPLLRH